MRVDIHTHYIPRDFVESLKKSGAGRNLEAELFTGADGTEMIRHQQGFVYPMFKGFYDRQTRLEHMDQRRIDVDVLSVSPTIFYYWSDVETAGWVARTANESMAQWSKESERFMALGTLPMQSLDTSLKELEYLADVLGIKGIQIGPGVEGKGIWEPEFWPLFELADRYSLFILVHPYYVGDKQVMRRFYLANLIGNPLDTTICIASLIFTGVLERYPNIKWGLVHGGGYFPYQRGRLEHGFEVRPEPKEFNSKPPGCYLEQIYVDTITHHLPALGYTIESMGSEHVLLGSDYPFDMADVNPVKTVFEVAGINMEDKRKIMGANALRILGKVC